MSDGEYTVLMNDFLSCKITADEFERAYLDRFKSETREMDEQTFAALDELFADVDAFTNDPQLVLEEPGSFIDEAALRKRVAVALMQLETRQ